MIKDFVENIYLNKYEYLTLQKDIGNVFEKAIIDTLNINMLMQNLAGKGEKLYQILFLIENNIDRNYLFY